MIIVGDDGYTRDTLEYIAATTSGAPRPIMMFVEDGLILLARRFEYK